MTLTPSDIEQKTFSTALRGYNLDEVDDFLDEVVRSMRKLHEELETARSELETKSAEPDEVAQPVPAAPPFPAAEIEPPPPPPPATPIDESAVGKALIAAQETAERIVNDARSEADEILVRAQNEADTFEESRLLRKEEAEQEITRIDGLVDRVKAELADLSVAVGAELEEMSGAIDTAITDLGGSLGEQVETEEDLEADEEFSPGSPDGEPEEENVVAAISDPADEDTDGADEAPSGRRRHRSEFGDSEAADDSGSEDNSAKDDSTEDDSTEDDSTEDDSTEDDSTEDDSEDDYFNFPDGDDDEVDESESQA